MVINRAYKCVCDCRKKRNMIKTEHATSLENYAYGEINESTNVLMKEIHNRIYLLKATEN